MSWSCPFDYPDGSTGWVASYIVSLWSVRPAGTTAGLAAAAATAIPPGSVAALNALIASASVAPAMGAEQTNFDRLRQKAIAWQTANFALPPEAIW